MQNTAKSRWALINQLLGIPPPGDSIIRFSGLNFASLPEGEPNTGPQHHYSECHPAFVFVCSTKSLLWYHPLIILKKLQRSVVSAVARQYQIHEVLFTKVSIWHQRVLLGDRAAGDIMSHLMNRASMFACATTDWRKCESEAVVRNCIRRTGSYEGLSSSNNCLSHCL